MITTFKQKAISFIENKITHEGTVLAIRAWTPATFFEVDIHLPEVTNMENWLKAQYLKIRVAPLVFRDYTPAGWDAETRTCTLYIDSGHGGAGNKWVNSLKIGDTFNYIEPTSAHQKLSVDTKAVFLGDQTAIGHFLALAQLAGNTKNISGAIVLPNTEHREQFSQNLKQLPLTPLPFKYELQQSLAAWLLKQSFIETTVFYLVGNSHLVATLRNRLKQLGFSNKQIMAQGFWH